MEGLSVGSPVKFHGVVVGKVTKIQFVDSVYPEAAKRWGTSKEFAHIYVLMAINPDNIPGPDKQLGFNNVVKHLVKQGLQVQISPSGLTGDSYISMGFYSPEDVQPIPVSWQSKYAYVPSVKSSLEYFSDSVKSISEALQQIDFVKLSDQMGQALASFNKMAQSINSFVNQIRLDPSMLLFTKPPKPIYQENKQ